MKIETLPLQCCVTNPFTEEPITDKAQIPEIFKPEEIDAEHGIWLLELTLPWPLGWGEFCTPDGELQISFETP